MFFYYHRILDSPWRLLPSKSSSPNYLFFHQPRLTGRGCGLAVIHRNNFSCSPVSLGCFSTFESLGFIPKNTLPILCILIYRPPKSNSGLIQEFSDFLSVTILKYDRVLILCDISIHVCCPSSSLASDFIKLLESFSLIQYVNQPSHDKGHTLDLVLSYGFCVDDVNLVDSAVSDHNAVLFQVPLLSPDLKPTTLIPP